MDATLAEGFKVLAAIAAGADAPGAIAARLDLSRDAVTTHVEALATGGFVRREGDRLLLAERATGLLEGLVGRVDLLAIAAPVVLEAETRLGVRIDIEIPDETEPSAVGGSAPFALVRGSDGRRALVAWALDAGGQIACALRTPIDGTAPEAIDVLGRELVAAAEAISARLPRPADRGSDLRR